MNDQPEALRLADRLAWWGNKDVREAASELRRQHNEIERLQAERDALKTELHIAVGMLSTQPDYSATHPMDVLQIVKDAAIDAARSDK